MVVVSERRGRAGELCSIVLGCTAVGGVHCERHSTTVRIRMGGKSALSPDVQQWPVYAVQTTVQQCGLMFENKVQCSAVGVKKEGVIFWQCFVTSLQYVRGIHSAVQ